MILRLFTYVNYPCLKAQASENIRLGDRTSLLLVRLFITACSRPCINGLASAQADSESFFSDVYGSVDIPVMYCTALMTLPLSDFQPAVPVVPESSVDASACTARLACVCWIHLDQGLSIALALIAEHADKTVPSGIADGSCKLVIVKHHLGFQIFYHNHIILLYEP